MSLDAWNSNYNKSQEYISQKIDRLAEIANVDILQRLPMDLSCIDVVVLDEDSLSTFDEAEFKKEFEIDKIDFSKLKKENVWEKPFEDLLLTAKYLFDKIYSAKNSLSEHGVGYHDVYKSIINKLLWDIVEAWEWERKFINWKITELVSYSEDTYKIRQIPYWSITCTNAVVDKVIINSRWKDYSLREINELLNKENDNGEFFLPANLWMSSCLICKWDDGKPFFLAQDRNLKNTAIQTAWLVSGCSWTCEFDKLMADDTLDSTRNLMDEEFMEELWLDTISKHVEINEYGIIQAVKDKVSDISELHTTKAVKETIISWATFMNNAIDSIQREVNLPTVVLPVALVNNRVRSTKPELLFVAFTSKSFKEIQEAWEKAEWKWESNKLVWMETDKINQETKSVWKWSELSPHFLMSYLGYYMLLEDKEIVNH